MIDEPITVRIPPPSSASNNNNKPILVICDLQPDLLGSFDASNKQDFLKALSVVVEAARKHKWNIFYSTLQFSSSYQRVPQNHKLYGAFRKLNQKLGDKAVHWFLEGWEGSQVLKEPEMIAPRPQIDTVVTREQHLPHELIRSILNSRHPPATEEESNNIIAPIPLQNNTQKVYLTGAKASGSVQITAQMLMDQGCFDLVCIDEAIQDDNDQKKQAVLQHILPIYADSIATLQEFVEEMGGLETFSKESQQAFVEHYTNTSNKNRRIQQREQSMPTATPLPAAAPTKASETKSDTTSNSSSPTTFLICDCGRMGHGSKYTELLLQRTEQSKNTNIVWQTYPTQIWYEDMMHGKEYYCPVGKQVVDFCDEPEFSNLVSMYLLGREWLDEKDKFLDIANYSGGGGGGDYNVVSNFGQQQRHQQNQQYMPKTYCFEKGKWRHGLAPEDDNNDENDNGPWFVKEANKNLGGAAINIVTKTSEIADHLLFPNDRRYVVQAHIRDPLLTDDGKKTHIKFYVLLVCEDDGITWTLYTYKASLLSISPNPWSATDLSHDTQVTIHRHPEPPGETAGWKQHWDKVYQKCKEGTAHIIQRAIAMGRLKGRKRVNKSIIIGGNQTEGYDDSSKCTSGTLFQKQFEVFSVDWMPDIHGNVWVLECNMSPAVAQPEFEDPSHRDARRDYLMRHDEAMLKEALEIVLPSSSSQPSDYGQWDFAGTFCSDEER
ncbi:unnamed protein product [Cylindrotheca closterium]|uniref:Uncharacterized protein n=1 Tax=Cylindrotheca closterium TaxID=2856 RepID=A0AAD2CXE9_9STRA|nr:unnamed protein product [Cylindrotheca closterium]